MNFSLFSPVTKLLLRVFANAHGSVSITSDRATVIIGRGIALDQMSGNKSAFSLLDFQFRAPLNEGEDFNAHAKKEAN